MRPGSELVAGKDGIAMGIPVGSDLEYVDLGTIAHAYADRR